MDLLAVETFLPAILAHLEARLVRLLLVGCCPVTRRRHPANRVDSGITVSKIQTQAARFSWQ
jgi:hypothetical protein